MTNIHSPIDTNPNKLSATILIVDDSEIDRAVYTRYLHSDVTTKYQISEAETVQKALEICQTQHFDVVLIDFYLPDGDGLELLEAIGKEYLAQPPVIILTGQGNERIAVNAMKKGAADYLIKQDITDISLCNSIHNLLNITAFNRKITRLQDQEALIAGVALHIRQSLELETVYRAIVEDVRLFLKTDRTLIYKFHSDMSGEIVAEAVVPPWIPCIHSQIIDTCFQEKMVEGYSDRQIFAVEDIYTANLQECHLQLLESFQVRANLVVPIFLPNGNFHSHQSHQPLWGLLVVHQCSAPRNWDNADISLIQQLSVQLAIAIQQAELYNNLQVLNASLEQKVEERTRELAASEQKLRAIFNNTFQFTGLLTTTGILVEVNQHALEFGGVQLADVVNRPLWETYWWTISPKNQDDLQQAIASAAQGEFISYEVDIFSAGGNIATIDFSLSPLKDELGQVRMLIGEGRDITAEKRLERERQAAIKALEASEAELRGLFNAMVDVILVLDKQGRYLKIAPTKTDNFYRMPAEVMGKTVHEVFPTHLADMCVDIIGQTLATQQTLECEYNLQIGSRTVWFLAKVSPISPDTVIWAARDITVAKRNAIIRQQVEQAFEDSQILLQLVMDSLPMSIFWKDRNSRYLGCNRRLLLDAGLSSSQEIIGKTDFDMPWREEAPLYQADDSLVIESGQSKLNIEEPFTKIGNISRWLRTNKIPLKTSNGEIIGVLCSYEDITEQREIEGQLKTSEQERDHLLQVLAAQNQTLEAKVTQRTIELQKSQERFRNLLETSSDWVWEVNELGIYTYVSPQIFKILGYLPAEVLGKSPFDFMPPEEAARVFQEFSKFASVQAPFQCLENINLHKDGRLITLETSAVPIIDEDGQFCGYRGMDRDITVRKQIEITLRDSEEFNRSIFENNADCLKILDPDGNIISLNQAGITLMEIDDPSQVLGKQWIQYWAEPDQSLAIQALETAKSGQITRFQGFSPTHKGIPKWWDILVAPVSDLNGNILRLITTARDITANKQAEEQLHNLSDRLNLAIKSGQIGIWDWNIITNNVIWDDRMYELYGINPSEFVNGYEIWEATLHPDDLLPTRIAIKQAIAGTKDFDTEYRIIWADGTIKFIKAYAIVQRDSDGKAQRMIGINFDISDRKKSEAKLQAAEIQLRNLSDRLKLAVKSAKIGIWDFDLINDSVVWDERMYKIFGVSPVNFDPSQGAWGKFEQFVYPYDRVALREAVQQVITNKQELDVEFRIVLHNGSVRILKGHGLVQYNAQGQPQRMIGINYDITNHRREELQNKRLKDRLEFVLAASPAIIYTCQVSINYETTFISKNVQNVLGYTKETWLAEPNFWINHIHPEDLPQVLARLSDLQAQEHQSSQYRFLHQDGSYYWLEDEFRLVLDEMGKITEIIGYIVDISQRKQAEIQLQETNKQLAASNEQLTRATRLKDEFLANMSHELRTPLNAILGISEGLQDQVFGMINERQRRSLQTIERSGNHLLELINDILDLSKIEAGQMQLDCIPVTINQLCQSSLAFIKQQAFQKQIQLHVQIQPNLPDLLVDERRIRQVLINLLNNAVKFTLEGGTVTLVVTRKEHPPESKITHQQDLIRIAVIDTGIGIAPENISKLFQPFVQIDSSLSRKYAGSGLGLSLVKRIVEMHGGQVDVSSEIGVGSSFFVDLPCLHTPSSTSQSVNQSQGNFFTGFDDTVKKSPVILLAEDNKGNILTFSSYLEAKGYRVISAKDGLEAIELTKSHCPDLILMDIQMPEMDGLEAIKQIRSNPDLATLPIIALTALVMPGDREKCLAAGANEYLSKPLKLKNLVNTIQQLLG
jgi:PAS domain S-box-containing protein